MPLSPVRLQKASRVIKTFPRAAYFNGVNAYVYIPDSPVLRWGYDPFTIVLTILSNYTGVDVLRHASTLPGKTGGFRFLIHPVFGLKVDTWSSDTNEWLAVDSNVFPTAWTQYVLVRQDPTWMWYINGSFKVSKTDTRTGREESYAGFYLGRALYGYWYRGYVSQLIIYSRALNDSEVQQIYADPSNPPTNGLVLWLSWDSLDCGAGKWYDKSGYNNHGTLYNVQCVDYPTLKKPVRILSPVR